MLKQYPPCHFIQQRLYIQTPIVEHVVWQTDCLQILLEGNRVVCSLCRMRDLKEVSISLSIPSGNKMNYDKYPYNHHNGVSSLVMFIPKIHHL